jgi:hypothetical protein
LKRKGLKRGSTGENFKNRLTDTQGNIIQNHSFPRLSEILSSLENLQTNHSEPGTRGNDSSQPKLEKLKDVQKAYR